MRNRHLTYPKNLSVTYKEQNSSQPPNVRKSIQKLKCQKTVKTNSLKKDIKTENQSK